MTEKIVLNEYGFYQRKDMPSREEIGDMYENQFYQGEIESSTYHQKYSEQETRNFVRNAAKKELMIRKNIVNNNMSNRTMLEVGCGEGYVLNYFNSKGWEVCGIDFSEYGVKKSNPDILPFLIKGDCNSVLDKLISQNIEYDVINTDLYIECCFEPVETLQQIKKVMRKKNSLLIVRTANSISPLHRELLKRGILRDETWFDRAGNYSYFNKESLKELLENLGFECLEWYGDTFVDFNLINPIANYYDNKNAGKACYQAMLDIEDIIENDSLEKLVELERVMGDLGFGRHITCVCRVEE